MSGHRRAPATHRRADLLHAEVDCILKVPGHLRHGCNSRKRVAPVAFVDLLVDVEPLVRQLRNRGSPRP